MPRPRGTGCITCRIRRVKCDETKPCCRRCETTGRKCDGYMPPNSTHSRRELVALGRLTPIDRLSLQERQGPAQALSASPTLSQERSREYQLFDIFRDTLVPSATALLPSQFWRRDILQLAHSEPAIWYAAVTLAAIQDDWQGRNSPRALTTGGKGGGSHHYFRAVSLGSAIVDQNVALRLSLALGAAANMMGRIREGRMHIRACRDILSENGATGGTEHATQMLARLDLEAMTIGEETAPYPCEDSVILRHTLATAGGFEDYEEAANDMMRLFRATFVVEEAPLAVGEVAAAEAHIPRGLERWERNMRKFEEPFEFIEGIKGGHDMMPAITLRLYHAILNIYLVKASIGPETRFDDHLDMFVRATVLAEALARLLEQSSQKVTMEPGLVMAVFLVGTNCRHPMIRRWNLGLLKRVNRQEGLWRSDAAAAVVQRVIEVEEAEMLLCAGEESGLKDGPTTHNTKDDIECGWGQEIFESRLREAMCLPWGAWRKPGFKLPAWETWEGVRIIPEDCRVRSFSPHIIFPQRYIKLLMNISSGNAENGYRKTREEIVFF